MTSNLLLTLPDFGIRHHEEPEPASCLTPSVDEAGIPEMVLGDGNYQKPSNSRYTESIDSSSITPFGDSIPREVE